MGGKKEKPERGSTTGGAGLVKLLSYYDACRVEKVRYRGQEKVPYRRYYPTVIQVRVGGSRKGAKEGKSEGAKG